MQTRNHLILIGAAIACCFSFGLLLFFKTETGPSIAPVPKENRFEALMPFRRDECIEVTTRRHGRIFIEDTSCGLDEVKNAIRHATKDGKNIKAVVLIVGVDGDTDFELIKSVLLSTVSQPTKLYYFHENSRTGLEYLN
jgi:biopolymer transport protein ExbD